MATAKQAVADILARVPASASFEDIQYQIYVREIVEKRLSAKQNGHLLSQQAVERRMKKWLGKSSG